MNKKRAQFTYTLTGQIHHKNYRQNPQYTQHFYQLNITCENQPNIKKIFAFKDKVSPSIWQTIDQGNCFQQRYKFFCRNYAGHYYLINWEVEHE